MQGIIDSYVPVPTWKRDILFLDKIVLVSKGNPVEQCEKFVASSEFAPPSISREMEFLLSTSYFEHKEWQQFPNFPDRDTILAARNALVYFKKFSEACEADLPKDDSETYMEDLDSGKWVEDTINFHMKHGSTIRTLIELTFQTEIAYQNAVGNSSVSLRPIGYLEGPLPEDIRSAAASDVLKCAIHAVPVPDEKTPWEDIFRLKSDRDLNERARKLRLWAHDLANRNISIDLANEYLADSIADYERFLKAHRVKTRISTLKSVFVAPLQFAEDVIKLRVGKLAERAVSIKEARVDAILSELQAPGRAVSFITSIREKLGSPK